MSHEFDNTAFNDHPDFGLPEGYFQKSAKAVFTKIEWLEEHKNFPALSALRNHDVFKVPVHYFDVKAHKLELIDFPVLSALTKKNNFSTPENYFETSEIKALSNLIGDHENTLDFVPRELNFTVEPDYFLKNKNELAQLLLKRKEPARIVALFGVKGWMAAAALLVVALGFWMYNFYFDPSPIKDCGTMACVDKADLLKAKNLENMETDDLYELVNTKQLEQKLEKKSAAASENKTADSLDEPLDDLMDEI